MPSSRQVAVCALPLSNNASAEANVQLSMPLCANSRTTPLRKPALSIDHDHDCQSALPYPCPAPVRYVWPTLDLDQRNLVRRRHAIFRKLFAGLLAATAWASYEFTQHPRENDQKRENDHETYNHSTSFCVRALKHIRICRHQAIISTEATPRGIRRTTVSTMAATVNTIAATVSTIAATVSTTEP